MLHTPDFFVIERDGMGWEEWRPHARLLALASEHPKRYQLDESDTWHFVPGERFAEPLGLFFRLRSSADINPTLTMVIVSVERQMSPLTVIFGPGPGRACRSSCGSTPPSPPSLIQGASALALR